MKAYGAAGAAVTARTGIDLPTGPARRPAHWPAHPDRTAWTSPIGPSLNPAATKAAERAATRTAIAETAPRATGRRRGRRATGREAGRGATVGTRRHAPLGPGSKPSAVRLDRAATRMPRDAEAGRPVVTARAASGLARVDRAEQLAQLRARWDAGMPQAQIAAELGVSVSQVQRLRRAAGLARRHQRLDGEQIVRLYVEDRLSLDAIAAQLGTSPAGVRYRLEAAGIARRSPGQENALPATVRAEALARIAAGERPVDVQRALGIGETTLLRWRRAADAATRAAGGAR